MLPTDPIDAIEEPSGTLNGVAPAIATPGLKKTAATITRNFTSLLLGRLGCQVFNFTTNAYLARRIAPAGFGAIGVAQAIMGYLSLFSDSGLNVIAMREGAQNPSGMQALIGSITGLRLVLSCAFLPVGLLAAEFLPSLSDSSRTVLRIFALSLPLGAVALDWVFRALQRMQYNAILQVATAFLTLVLTLALVRGPHDLVRVPWAGIAAGAGVFLLSLHLLARTGHRLSINLRLGESRHYLAHSFPLCAASLAVTLYTLANNLILGQVHGDAEVGIYVAATKLAGMCFVSTWIFHAAMSPALMGLYARSRQDAARLLAESVRFTAVAGCGIVAVGAVGARLAVRIVFGAAFAPAVPALAVMLCGGAVVAVAHNWGQLAIAAHREKLVLRATIAGGVTNLIVCGLLVHRFGSLGAAIGTLSAEIVVGAALILPWPREVGTGALRAAVVPALLALLAFAAGFQFAARGPLVAASITGAVYAIGLVVTGSISAGDFRRLRDAFFGRAGIGEEGGIQ